jgi:nucleoside-diphosphate-sugar epimerase
LLLRRCTHFFILDSCFFQDLRYYSRVRVLVIGCGYVGFRLAVELAGEGHQVFGLRRSRVLDTSLHAAGIQPLVADITRPATLALLPSNFDWIVDCVSSSSGGPGEYRQVYLEGLQNLLAWLAPNPPACFLYTSSTGVYGQDDGSIVDEHSPTEPQNETGRILVAAERRLLNGARQAFPAIVLRLAGIYGPGRGYWLKQFLSGHAVIEGRGDRFLNMIHVDDVVGAIATALVKGAPGAVYNVVDNEPVQQMTVFQWLSRTLGRELPPFGGTAADNPGKRSATNKRVSNRKLTGELAYQLKYPTFREGYTAELARIE